MISIHEIHLYSLKFNLGGKFLEIKDLIHGLFKIIPITQDTCIKDFETLDNKKMENTIIHYLR